MSETPGDMSDTSGDMSDTSGDMSDTSGDMSDTSGDMSDTSGDMSDTSGEHLQEEPQEERGPEGSRDEGSDEPGGGPVDRPAGTADGDDHTGINPDDTDADHPEAPDLQSGGN